MSYFTFTLRSLLFAMAVCAIGIFAFQRFLPRANTWRSGLRDSEIQSATVDYSVFTKNVAKTYKLTKDDSIRLLRLAESCPTRDFDHVPTQYLPDPKGRDGCVVEIKLSGNRTLSITQVLSTLVVGRGTLIDISSKDEKIKTILWPSK